MIDPRELRIGNILNVLSGERVLIPSYQVKIAEIGFLGCEVYQIEDHSAKTNWVLYDHQHLDPIPLTPEWLERFGFEKYNDDANYEEGYKLGGFNVQEYTFTDSVEYACLGVDVKTIHQLQNLYFALTNSELTLKDTP